MKNTITPPSYLLGRGLFSAGKQKASCPLKPLLYLISGGLLSFSSLIYAVEQGEYKHYVGFGLSGVSFSDSLQEISVGRDAGDPEEEGGGLLVWDRFNSDNSAALSLMFLSVNEELYSGHSFSASGPSVVWKYFMESGFYVGGGGTLLSGNEEYEFTTRVETSTVNVQGENTFDSSFAPTLVLGYRGIVSRLENSHFYIGVDWIRTLPVDIDGDVEETVHARGQGITTISGTVTYPDLFISMIAVSFGWAW